MIIFMKETKGLSEDQVKRLYRSSDISSGKSKYNPVGRDENNY